MKDAVTVDDVLDRLEELDEADDVDALRRELARALTRFPDAPELREWEASLAVDEERFADAVAILDGVLAVHPRRYWAQRERAAVLIDLGRFADALAALQGLPRPEDRLDRGERAAVHHDLALCLDRLGRIAEADAAFGRAAALDAATFFVPLRLPRARFETLVATALDDIPEEFAPYLAQVVVRVRDYPGPDEEEPFQLGVYVGVARPERTLATEDHLDHVVVFQRSHELQCPDEDALREEVCRTVVHEIAHHFGIVHEAMGEYE